ncbi:MAG: isochorismatase family protein [Proteobacteria bacterium]|nr:isochorismatase family protein [Pseudomonadota bacterium]
MDFARPGPPLNPATSALIVVDMQRFFSEFGDLIADRVHDLARAASAAGLTVVFTQHGHADPPTDGGMLGDWWGDLCVEGSEPHGFLPSMPVELADRVLPKRRYSAFVGTDLDAWLRARGIDDVTVCGVLTNLCVESTARDAFMRDFRVRVVRDAVGCARPALHEASLANLAYGFAHVPTAAQWRAQLP